LCGFNIETPSHDSKYYSCIAVAILVGLDRYLNKENMNFGIITEREFKTANDVPIAHLVEHAQEGKNLFMKLKPALTPPDVKIL